jgi:two-component system, chemotaxis family, protein-glutamate methylesterase/glutaminase
MHRAITKVIQPGQRIRVMVVDDSVVIRRLVTHALEKDPLIEVVGTAPHGAAALERIPQWNPDVITLDVEMPEMDGLETLRRLRVQHPQIRVVMFSTVTERGAAVTMEALALGADDYVTKVSNAGSLDESMARLIRELVPKLRQFFHIVTKATPPAGPPKPVAVPARTSLFTSEPQVVAIGVSTGGPSALNEVLPRIPAEFPLPILIVQHMPPMFTRLLAERLANVCPLRVEEATAGMPVIGGRILIAPGDWHMRVVRDGNRPSIVLDQSVPLNSCRPSVDALLFSLDEVYRGSVLACILTGMGQDGMRGASMLKARGARVIAQDEATSVVWGMPGAVVDAGLADRVVPLDRIADEIMSHTVRGVARR